MRIKIGDIITTNQGRIGEVHSIQICHNPWDKYGENVNSVDTSEHRNGTITYGKYWCYFEQIDKVKPNTTAKN